MLTDHLYREGQGPVGGDHVLTALIKKNEHIIMTLVHKDAVFLTPNFRFQVITSKLSLIKGKKIGW